ncbi:hypothetical protein CEUSTIGMA_g10510.t1 [Chlamydomonas eustigma]|uniref:Uncharacterized protein n=1 Tax=Chlamydomonas eustigma TaxID=1157962 RepID=A0A250XJ28_9CHLO|nr:hypothetical protein CEUSTIGMA_g10510.t1 [Chlamydomonas eustigma]|eukprot:GAX83084.1 hypothetical protein CEUSTIGMA_g10510.t1 [Chlamydomonas eustigma]
MSRPSKQCPGYEEEIMIILSCPGDEWPVWEEESSTWIPSENCAETESSIANFRDDGRKLKGWVHKTFEDIAKRSSERIYFCPVQSPDLRKMEEEIQKLSALYPDLWKAEWLATVKSAVAKAASNKKVQRILFVTILGGGNGSEAEWGYIEKFRSIVERRAKLMDIAPILLDFLQCVIACGTTKCCCVLDGCKSGHLGLYLVISQFGFCLPIKVRKPWQPYAMQ